VAGISFESVMACDECVALMIAGDTAGFESWLPDVWVLSFRLDADSTVTDEEAVWVLLLLLLTTVVDVLEKVGVVRLPAAEVTEDATVVTEEAAWTTED
jgi:hypothetical protein